MAFPLQVPILMGITNCCGTVLEPVVVLSSKVKDDPGVAVADTALLEGVGWRGGPPDFKGWKKRLLMLERC